MLLAYITKQGCCHISNIAHTAFLLFIPMEATMAHLFMYKTQPTATSTSHVIAINAHGTHMPITLNMFYIFHGHM